MKSDGTNAAIGLALATGRGRRLVGLCLLVGAWLGAAGLGLRWLLAHSGNAGPLGQAPATWPAGSALRPAPGRPTLLMFAHPHCACTPAALEELAWLRRASPGGVDVTVLFVRPPGAPGGWEHTATWDRASALPRVTVLADEGGREARRFGATTSGEVLAYDAGRLVFQGGLTEGPGRCSTHAVARALLGRLRSGGEVVRRPAYGCPLLGTLPGKGDDP